MHVIYLSELFLCVEVTLAGVVVHATAVGALSLNYTMIMRSDGFPHLWLGDFMTIGAYASFVFVKVLGQSPYLGMPTAFILGGVIGVLFYRAVIKKLHDRGVGPVYMTLGSLGLGVLISVGAYILAYWLKERFYLYSTSFSLTEYDSSLLGVPTVVYVSSTLAAALLLSVTYLPKAPQGVTWRERSTKTRVCFRSAAATPTGFGPGSGSWHPA
jgi:branched-chain amino acid transport system permease protein